MVGSQSAFFGQIGFQARKSLTALLAAAAFALILARGASAADLKVEWLQTGMGPEAQIARAVAVLPNGDVAVVGTYGGEMTLGKDQPGQTVLSTVSIYRQGFVARYAADGRLLWAKKIEDPTTTEATAVAACQDGSICVAGSTTTRTFISKYNADGTVGWTKYVNGPVVVPGGLAVASDGTIGMTGRVMSSNGTAITFGPGESKQTIMRTGAIYASNAFIAKYESNGTLAWAKQVIADSEYMGDRGYAICALSDNSFAITGCYFKTATFGKGEAGETSLVPVGSEIFLARYKADGALMWAKRVGGNWDDYGNLCKVGSGIAAGKNDVLFLTGWYNGTCVFGPGEARQTSLTSAGREDGFIARYTPSGALEWVKNMGGIGRDWPQAVAVCPDGNPVATGYYGMGPATFGKGEAVEITLPGGTTNSDIFLAKYTVDGAVKWVGRAFGPSADEARAVAVDKDGAMFVAGSFYSNPVFGVNGTTQVTATADYIDSFLVKYRREGASSPPDAKLTASALTGHAPLEVRLDYSGSDVDGAVTGYRLDFGDGSAALEAAAPGAVSHLYTRAGTYTASLTVTDNDGLTASASCTITVAEPLPVTLKIDEVTPASGNIPFDVTIKATATSPAGGDIIYSWDFDNDGQADAVTVGASGAQTQVAWRCSAAGTHTVKVRALDSRSMSAEAAATVKATAVPEARLTASALSGHAPVEVRFDYSGSDVDGNVTGYRLDFGDGSTALEAAAPGSVSHTYARAGTYKATLTVTDNDGLTAGANCTITVAEPLPVTLKIDEVSPSSGNIPFDVTIKATATSPAGGIIKYCWDFDNDGQVDAETSGQSGVQTQVIWSCSVAGTYTVKVRALDSRDMTAEAAATVKATAVPVATLTASPLTGNAPLEVKLDYSGSDVDGNVTGYRLDFGDGSTALEAAAPGSVSHTYARAGTYKASLTVTDNDGLSASASCTITVAEPLPVTLKIDEVNPTSGNIPFDVTIKATATSPTGGTIKYYWDFDGDGQADAVTSGASGAQTQFTWSCSVAGTYTIKVRAVDSRGMSAEAATTVKADQAPQETRLCIWFATPKDGDTVSGAEVKLRANVAPANLAARVRFQYYDGSWKDITGWLLPTPCSFATTWDTSRLAPGKYVLRATGQDVNGAEVFDEITVTVAAEAKQNGGKKK